MLGEVSNLQTDLGSDNPDYGVFAAVAGTVAAAPVALPSWGVAAAAMP
jgi:hypothetical protein